MGFRRVRDKMYDMIIHLGFVQAGDKGRRDLERSCIPADAATASKGFLPGKNVFTLA